MEIKEIIFQENYGRCRAGKAPTAVFGTPGR